jgi:hypothetical protein
MAERRMFAKSIVLSDAFLDMPASARCLYFTLSMFADDDGFVNTPKGIMRQCGACEDDFKILLAKKFLLAFETGVIVIKHWRINNYLRKDRYTETKYLEEKKLLGISENGAYTLGGTPPGIPSIGKDSIGKDSIGKFISFSNDENSENFEMEEEEKEIPEPLTKKTDPFINPLNEIFSKEYQKVFNNKPYLLTNQRNKLTELAAEIEDFKETIPIVLEKLKNVEFDLPNFNANYIWLLKEDNYLKVLSGTYDKKKTALEKEIENYEVDEYGN